MASITYSDKVGVSEAKAPYDHSLHLIGKQDSKGRTIGISYFSWTGLRMVPLVLRTLGFLFLLLLPLIRRPFGWLPVEGDAPAFLQTLHDWQAFSWATWFVVIAIYAAYFVASYLKNSIYTGLPGAEIHFSKHKEITETIKPGERQILFDPRVKPYAVVSTKPIAIEMPEVEGNTRDNISLTFRGALIFRVADTYRLLVEGGFEKFVAQLKKTYQSMLKDAIVGINAQDFNRFMIEDVPNPGVNKENITEKLELLGNTDLTIGFLTQLTEIDEVDVSTFDLSESESPKRREMIGRLRQLAENYGIEIVDHIPLGNSTSEAYLKSLARPLANSITRLEQSTDTLKEITEEEISEEISANVADKEIGVLEIRKIIKEIESITATLRDEGNEQSIVHAKEVAMQNAQASILSPKIAGIDSLMAQVQAKAIDTAGLERYVSECEDLLARLEGDIDQFVPHIDRIMVEKMTAEEVVPNMDIVENMLETSGTNAAFDKLKEQIDQTAEYENMEEEIHAIEQKAEDLDVEASIQQIEQAVNAVTSDSGISTEEYTPENISRKIDRIAEEADLETGAASEQQEE